MPTDASDKSTLRIGERRPVDEHANLVTHALGFFLSVVASVVLMRLVPNDQRTTIIIACGVYCCTLIGLYAASTCSHLFHDVAWRRFFRTVDQACIYLLIAGSFTPIAVVYLWHGWWPALLAAMWILALGGVVLVLRMRDLTPTAKFTYGLLGWLPIISLKTLVSVVPLEVFAWLVAGGLCYSFGTFFLRFDQHIRYFHALWHTFVIAGSTCHYIAILMIVL